MKVACKEEKWNRLDSFIYFGWYKVFAAFWIIIIILWVNYNFLFLPFCLIKYSPVKSVMYGV